MKKDNAGKSVSKLGSEDLPPCTYSINAFGTDTIFGYSKPPHFFRRGAKKTEWEIPKSTVCVWPYEFMYSDNVYNENVRIDNNTRAKNVDEFFANIETGRSLIFYYANYSNPFSEEQSPRYVLIGVSRVKRIGERLSYDEVNDYVRERFADGMIWAKNVILHYPDEGFRLTCHRYRNDTEVEVGV